MDFMNLQPTMNVTEFIREIEEMVDAMYEEEDNKVFFFTLRAAGWNWIGTDPSSLPRAR